MTIISSIDWNKDLPPLNSTFLFIYCDQHCLHWSMFHRGSQHQITSWRTTLATINDMEMEPAVTLFKLLPKGVKNYIDSLSMTARSKKDAMYIYYLDTNISKDEEVPNSSQAYIVSKLFESISFPCLQFSLSKDDFASLTESLHMPYNAVLDVYEYTCFQYYSTQLEGPIVMIYSHFHGGGSSIIHFDPKSNPGHRVINIQRHTDDIISIIKQGQAGSIGPLLHSYQVDEAENDSSSKHILTLIIVGESVNNIKTAFEQVDATGGFGIIKGKFNVKCFKRAFSNGIHALMNAKRVQLGMEVKQEEPQTPVFVSHASYDTKKTKYKRVRVAKDFLGKGIFYGTVKGVSNDKDGNQTWFIQYDDGDSEDFTDHDLEMARFFYDSLQGAKSRKKMKQVGPVVRSQNGVQREEMVSQDSIALESLPPNDDKAAPSNEVHI